MIKRIVLSIIILSIFSAAIQARIKPQELDGVILYKGNELALSYPLIEIEETVFVPLKDMTDSLRLKMHSLAVSGRIKIEKKDTAKTILLMNYNKTAVVNNATITLGQFPIMYRGVMYVPFIEVFFHLGYQVKREGVQFQISDTLASTKPQLNTHSVAVVTSEDIKTRSSSVDIDAVDVMPQAVIPLVPPLSTDLAHTPKISSGVFETTSIDSCWVPDLSAFVGSLTFDVRGRIYTKIGEQVRRGVLFVPAQTVFGPFDYTVKQEKNNIVMVRQIIDTKAAKVINTLVIERGSGKAQYGGKVYTLTRTPFIENDVVYVPVVDLCRILKIGCRWKKTNKTVYIEPRVEEIYIEENMGSKKVVIRGSDTIEAKKTMELRDPYRIILDIPHSILDVPKKILESAGSGIQRVRAAQFEDDITRIVLELDEPRTYGLASDAEGKKVIVDFVPWIQRIAVHSELDELVIDIEATGPLEYEEKVMVQPDRIAFTFPHTVLKTVNQVDVHAGAVQRVRASQLSWSPLLSRVVVDLTKPVEHVINKEGNSLQLRIKNQVSFSEAQRNRLVLEAPAGTENAVEVFEPEQKAMHADSGLKGKRIIIDPGHGGQDPGAIAKSGLQEKEYTLLVAKELQKILHAEGAIPLMTLEDDVLVSMEDRARFAERNKGDVLISIHLNSFIKSTIRGAETYWYKDSDYKLADIIHKQLITDLKIPEKGLKNAQMYILNHITIPGVLVEPIFISNEQDQALIRSAQFRYNLAKSISQGLKKYFQTK